MFLSGGGAGFPSKHELKLMIRNFFKNLSRRFYHENDLSDMTWALCETSNAFKAAFIHFFFPDITETDTVTLIREKGEGDSRPDFTLTTSTTEDGLYLIEIKINDKNHHFEQYIGTYKIPPDHLGYITNYPLSKYGFKTHTWTEFYMYAKEHIPQDEEELWSSYLVYLKSVCNIITKAMHLSEMYSLYAFYKSLDEVFEFNTEKFSSELYDSKKDTHHGGNSWGSPVDGIMGKYFGIQFKRLGIKAWGWMGVYFKDEEPQIYISFDNRDDWGLPIYELLKNSDLKDGEYTRAPYEQEGGYWFEFKCNEDFDESNELSKQKSSLRSFFEEVMNMISDLKNTTH